MPRQGAVADSGPRGHIASARACSLNRSEAVGGERLHVAYFGQSSRRCIGILNALPGQSSIYPQADESSIAIKRDVASS